ncbi:MAG: hypothetical protein OEM64_01030 [Gammaproteobacteria bacterium]|nr:hypothetical protein [Gammaproteobacteria bacterium]MDH3414870.1 hypothetical protein [Gammaproteobacteria bacterium]
MNNKIEVTFEGDHIRVIADGDKDYRFMDQLWREVVTACDLNNCYNVLGIADTTTPVEAVEGYELPRLFQELGIDQRYRIAWVELNENARDMIVFVQTVLANRGLPGLVFDTEEEARDWLLGS